MNFFFEMLGLSPYTIVDLRQLSWISTNEGGHLKYKSPIEKKQEASIKIVNNSDIIYPV